MPTPRPWPIPFSRPPATPLPRGPLAGTDQRGRYPGEHPRRSVAFSRQAGPDDVAVLFGGRAWHPRPDQRQLLLPAAPATAENLVTEGLRMSDFDEMLRVVRRNVRAMVVMLDTCHAGALGIPSSRVVSADEMARQITAGEGSSYSPPPSPVRSPRSNRRWPTAPSPMPCWKACAAAPTAMAMVPCRSRNCSATWPGAVPLLTHGRQHPYNKMEGTDFTLLRVASGGLMPSPNCRLPCRRKKAPRSATSSA